MKYLKLLALVVAFIVIATGRMAAQQQLPPSSEPAWQQVVDYAEKNLPQEGVLRVNPDGFGYLKVDDDYIHRLFPMLGLAEQGYREPPYFRSEHAPGAHISIFYSDEHISPEEVGQTFHFQLKDIVIVHPHKKSSYAILQVEAPELERLREKYGLSPKLHGYEYHISLAKKSSH